MRVCKNCGTNNLENMPLCSECGKPLYEDGESRTVGGYYFRPVPDEEIRQITGKRSSAGRLAAVIIALCLIAALLLILISFIRSGQDSVQEFDLISIGNKTFVTCNGEQLDGKIKGEVIRFEAAQNGSSVLVLTDKENLYAADKDGVKLVSDDCSAAQMSASGSSICYMKDTTLMLYSVKKEKSEKIADNAEFYETVVSPDGKTVAYGKTENNDLYLWEKGKSRKIDSNVKCTAVSDNAKYLYVLTCYEPPQKPLASDYEDYEDYKKAYEVYTKLLEEYNAANGSDDDDKEKKNENNVLYLYPSAKPEKCIRIDDMDEKRCNFIVSGDFSQILWNKNGKTYVSDKGDEPVRISRDYIVPADAEDVFFLKYGECEAMLYSQDKLLDHMYRSASLTQIAAKNFSSGEKDTLVYIGKDGKEKAEEKKIRYVDSCGDKVCWSDGSKTYVSDSSLDDKMLIGKDVRSIIADDKFACFYVLDEDDDLWYVPKNGWEDKERICDDVYSVIRCPDGGVFFIDDKEKLYRAEKTDYEKICKDVGSVYCGENSAFYEVYGKDDEMSLYISADGSSEFTCVSKSKESRMYPFFYQELDGIASEKLYGTPAAWMNSYDSYTIDESGTADEYENENYEYFSF